MWSGPRNLSTALMRSFGNRADIIDVFDEPFYASYLKSTNKKHPMFDEILISSEYGDFRGTGVLEIEDYRWKIVQYNLLLPIPNHLLKKYALEIKKYYKSK